MSGAIPPRSRICVSRLRADEARSGRTKVSPAQDQRTRGGERDLKKCGGILRKALSVRYEFIKLNRCRWRVRKLCPVLKVSRSGYYDWAQSGRERRERRWLQEQELLGHIRRIHKRSHGIFGYRRIAFKLKDEGIPCTPKRILKIMSKYGIKARTIRKYKPQTTKANPSHTAFENLHAQNFEVSALNKVWVSDITYIRVGERWVYLAVVIDLYTRAPVGWALSSRPNKELVCRALMNAYSRELPPKGLIHHSDCGSQYTSNAFKALLQKHGMTGSMNRVGNPYEREACPWGTTPLRNRSFGCSSANGRIITAIRA